MRHPSLAKCNLIASERFGPSATVHRDDFDKKCFWLGYRNAQGDVVWVWGRSFMDCLTRHDQGIRGTHLIPTAPPVGTVVRV